MEVSGQVHFPATLNRSGRGGEESGHYVEVSGHLHGSVDLPSVPVGKEIEWAPEAVWM
jgi:hypothetical protein